MAGSTVPTRRLPTLNYEPSIQKVDAVSSYHQSAAFRAGGRVGPLLLCESAADEYRPAFAEVLVAGTGEWSPGFDVDPEPAGLGSGAARGDPKDAEDAVVGLFADRLADYIKIETSLDGEQWQTVFEADKLNQLMGK